MSSSNANPASNTVNDKILALVAPIVTDLKLDLYDLEFNGGILKVTIDTPPGSAGGVTLDQLALVTRLVGRDFDHHDPIPGHYTLEVSSPGLERTLRTPAHFQREMGKTVNIRLRANAANLEHGGSRRLQGVLVAADETTATIRLDDAALTERVIPIDSIDRAKTVFQWEKGEKLTPSTGTPKSKAKASTGPSKRVPKNSPKRTNTKSSVAAGGVKPPPGPSDELDLPIEEESA
jgi:ribosome maturation factor RimP